MKIISSLIKIKKIVLLVNLEFLTLNEIALRCFNLIIIPRSKVFLICSKRLKLRHS